MSKYTFNNHNTGNNKAWIFGIIIVLIIFHFFSIKYYKKQAIKQYIKSQASQAIADDKNILPTENIQKYATDNLNINCNKGIISITFDDGLKEVYSKAFPLMKKNNIRASVAVIVNNVGKKQYLSWLEIDELRKNGWNIISHTITHPKLTKIPTSNAYWEIRESQRILKEKGYSEADFFVYPYILSNKAIRRYAGKYYKMSRGNHLYEAPTTLAPKDLSFYAAYPGDFPIENIHPTLNIKHLKNYLATVDSRFCWGEVYFHANSLSKSLHYKRFKEIMDYLVTIKAQVLTLSEIYSLIETKSYM